MSPEEMLRKSTEQIERLVAVREFINPVSYHMAYNLWNGTQEAMKMFLESPENNEQARDTFTEVLMIREDLLQDFERAAKRNPKWWFCKLRALLRRRSDDTIYTWD